MVKLGRFLYTNVEDFIKWCSDRNLPLDIRSLGNRYTFEPLTFVEIYMSNMNYLRYADLIDEMTKSSSVLRVSNRIYTLMVDNGFEQMESCSPEPHHDFEDTPIHTFWFRPWVESLEYMENSN